MDLFFYYVMRALGWLEPIALLLGLGVSVWAFRRCRKRGYLVIGAYFALWFFASTVLPPIKRQIREEDFSTRYTPETQAEISELYEALDATYQKLDALKGSAPYATESININLGAILLVLGLWLIARRETPLQQTPLG
jgi:hypothetical protein